MPQPASILPTSEVAPTRPLRCGVIGTGPQARFHREALTIRDSFQLVDDADAELLFIAEPIHRRALAVILMMTAGKAVVIEAPVALSAGETASVFDVVAEQDHCEVWRPRRQELDFLRALKTLRTGEIGELRQATLTLRQLAPWMLPQAAQPQPAPLKSADDDEQSLGVLATFGGHYFDQLLELVDSTPTRVFGRLSFETLSFDTIQGCVPAAGVDTGFIAVIEFSNGCVARIEIDLASSLSLGPSWTLQGQRGGYAAGRQSITVADGEVYDVAVEATPGDPYAELLARFRSNVNLQPHREIEVARLIEAVSRSSQLGNVVELGSDAP